MSTKRELTRAQQALNQQVENFIELHQAPVPTEVAAGAFALLIERYAEWDAVRRNLEGKGITGKRDTSAAASLPDQGSKRREVLDAFVYHWSYFHTGMTTDAAEARLGRPHQSVSARVHELEERCLLVDSGKRAKTRSGRMAVVYRPSPEALTMYATEKVN